MREEALALRSGRSGSKKRLAIRLFLLVCLGIAPSISLGQAWLPPKGEATYSMTYQNSFVKNHYTDGVEVDVGHIRSIAAVFELGYGVTDRLAVSAGLPYVYSKYYGSRPHPSSADDGSYHGTFQNYSFNVRYQALRDPVVVTPFVAANIPSHDYQFLAHSAAGRGVDEYLVGVSLGRRLDPILSDGYVHARYSYAFVDTGTPVDADRSNVNLELGYFLSSSFGVRALGAYSATHGGLAFAQVPRQHPLWIYHDRILDVDQLDVGGGVTVAMTGSIDLYASYFATVWGTNGHKLRNGITVGAGWNFSPQQVFRKLVPSRTAGRDPLR